MSFAVLYIRVGFTSSVKIMLAVTHAFVKMAGKDLTVWMTLMNARVRTPVSIVEHVTITQARIPAPARRLGPDTTVPRTQMSAWSTRADMLDPAAIQTGLIPVTAQ